jgi:hypothetical protein
MKKILKTVACITIMVLIPFIFPLFARFLVHINLFENVEEFDKYIKIFFNIGFLVMFAISAIIVYLIACNKEKLKEWIENRDVSVKTRDIEVSARMSEMVDESTKKKNFINNLNEKEVNNKLVAIGVQEELNLNNNKKEQNKNAKKDSYKDDFKILEDENNKLRFYSAYNIINQKTKELLNVIYCNKSMGLSEFKNILINNFKNRNRKNKNLTNTQKNEYANNKYETIKNGLQFLNIIEISDDNKIITLTPYGKTFVEKYIEKEVEGR